jgi:DNA repair protein RecO (recombination protein O)
MHRIHHTNGFILSSKNNGEANKILTIYTRELGLIKAVAQGIRLNKSKLRFSLQDLSYAKIDLVKGKEIWRVTSATNLNYFSFAKTEKESFLLIVRVSKLLERLCQGEESNERIFDDLIRGFCLLDNGDLNKEVKQALELHLVLRTMSFLGYIGDSLILKKYLISGFNHDLTSQLLNERQKIILSINKALIESQL